MTGIGGLLNKVPRTLSVFRSASNQWTTVPLRRQQSPAAAAPAHSPSHSASPTVAGQTLSLTTWNIQAWPPGGTRAGLILDDILAGAAPDIVFLQEVGGSARETLLKHPAVRAGYLATNVGDPPRPPGPSPSYSGVRPLFSTLTLLARRRFGTGGGRLAVDNVFRADFLSRDNRDVLCVDVATGPESGPGGGLRLLNVHLDPGESEMRRCLEVNASATLLREPGCRAGLVAGDFNARRPGEEGIIESNGLVDAWVALQEKADGGPGPGRPLRLAKIGMLGLQPLEIEILRPGLMDTGTPCSKHSGLRCTFAIN